MHSHAAVEEAIEWGECYGLSLDEDQKWTLYAGLGERADGSWAASLVGDCKGRQAGKNDTAKVRQGAGIDLFGEKLHMHTAHEFPTANEDFLRLVAIYEAYDDLRKSVNRIRYANGEQGIEFLNGARIKYRARTGGSGRGFAKADVVYYDEAQHVMPEHLGASFPTMLASPNFQAWFMGSAGFTSSRVWWRLRRQAIMGEGERFAYTEQTAQSVTVDGVRILLGSPAYLLSETVLLTHAGYAHGRVSHESMETMLSTMGATLFGREIACLWEPEPIEDGVGLVPEWDLLVDVGSKIEAQRAIALEVSVDRRSSAFAWAGRRPDGLLHVEAFDLRPGTGWVLEAAVALWLKWQLPIRVQTGSPAASFIDPMREKGVVVEQVSQADQARGLGQLQDAASEKQVRHIGDFELAAAVKGAELRRAGDVDVVQRRAGGADVTPFVAVLLAVGGVPSTIRKPKIHVLKGADA